MYEALKEAVYEANMALVEKGLVLLTWGNASAIDREGGVVAVKPSGVPYREMAPGHMVLTDLEGKVLEGTLKPSVDLPTHLRLYAAFEAIGGVVHTHSHYATCFAQASEPIPCFGTTHADYFYGEVPVADALTATEIARDYESHIGAVIVRCFEGRDPMHFPGVLAANHAPFAWGKTVEKAVENAYVLEEVARMALHTRMVRPDAPPIPQYLLDKHFLRKHGSTAYYGQR